MKPQALYVGKLRAMVARGWIVWRPTKLCACGEIIRDGYDWCSDTCAETHHKGDLPPKAPCTCTVEVRTLRMGHMFDCPSYVPHPEHLTHPMENA